MPGNMDEMGFTNQKWGVCGFTSTFYAMHDLNLSKSPQIVNAGKAFRVIAEIKTYLQLLKADGQNQALKDIQTFTQSFGVVNGTDYGKWTIESYLSRVNDAVGLTDDEILAEPMFGMAMPPDVLQDYIKRVSNFDSIMVNTSSSQPNGDGIVGVKKTTAKNMKLYDGLCHYMYKSGGTIYSWGLQFESVAKANAAYQVVRFIQLKK